MALELIDSYTKGSDTTSNTLTNTFYYLLANPDVYKRLEKEVDDAFPAQFDNFDAGVLANLPFLQAVLYVISYFQGTVSHYCTRNEAMRLAPAQPNGAQRVPKPHSGPVAVVDRYVLITHCLLH